MKGEQKVLWTTGVILLVLVVLLIGVTMAVEPFGASTSVLNVTRAPADAASNVSAYAGNVTELDINGYTVTQSWQGYFGNVTGTIQLADGSDNVMYNWTLASPQGEVYATRNNSVVWTNIQCFNYTALGNYTSEAGNGGTTSLYGTNLSQIESQYGILFDDVDGVNETFNLLGGATHDLFYTANQLFSQGECISTRVYDSTGIGVSNNFEEVLLYEPSTTSVVFASLLEEDVSGFDNRTHDFEMLVLEDGHGTDVSAVPYYFFVELQ